MAAAIGMAASPLDAALQVATSGNALRTRNITVRCHRTSIRLQDALWEALEDIATRERLTIGELVGRLNVPPLDRRDRMDGDGTLTSAVRTLVVTYYAAAASPVLPPLPPPPPPPAPARKPLEERLFRYLSDLVRQGRPCPTLVEMAENLGVTAATLHLWLHRMAAAGRIGQRTVRGQGRQVAIDGQWTPEKTRTRRR
jgi:predicted DNA-binding ribbon-helix-helix protein